MGWQTASVVQLIAGNTTVINSSGIFVYAGAPAKGSLIASITPAVGTDPYGNTYGGGFNVGVWSASTGGQLQHFGIDGNGNVYVASTTGVTVTYIQASDGSVLVYNSSGQGAGNLIASTAPAAGTDPAGNHYLQGFASYGATSATQVNQGFISFYTGSLAAGWTLKATLQFTAVGIVVLSGGLETGLNTLDDGSGNASISGALSVTGNLGVPTINGSANVGSAGLPNGNISGTSGAASAGTAHTHSAGSYAVTNGVHVHSI